jgi:hypothetical protein
MEPISLSLSLKRSRCEVKDATDAPPIVDVIEVCLIYGAEAIDMELLKEDPPLYEAVNDGFRDIFSLNESRGFRTASTADFLTQTLVPLFLLVNSDRILVFGFSGLVSTLFDVFSSIDSVTLFLY